MAWLQGAQMYQPGQNQKLDEALASVLTQMLSVFGM